jgi:hypothetical protein
MTEAAVILSMVAVIEVEVAVYLQIQVPIVQKIRQFQPKPVLQLNPLTFSILTSDKLVQRLNRNRVQAPQTGNLVDSG